MENKQIGILTFEQFQGKVNIGSTRIRVKWPLNYWPEAEEYIIGKKYQTIILQKAYWLEGLEFLEQFAPNQHIKILDICDADWLHWGTRVMQVIANCDAVTTSTVEQAEFLAKYTDKPIWCIPDRIDFNLIGDTKKQHSDLPSTTAVWYGYSENYPMLDSAITALVKHGITNLIVIANSRSPYVLPAGVSGKIQLSNLPWTAETVNDDILKADIVINPKSNKGRWRFKSNNKTINAWALGMPVAHTDTELADLIDPAKRNAEAQYRYQFVRDNYDVRDSVTEYTNLINELKQTKGII